MVSETTVCRDHKIWPATDGSLPQTQKSKIQQEGSRQEQDRATTALTHGHPQQRMLAISHECTQTLGTAEKRVWNQKSKAESGRAHRELLQLKVESQT